MHVELYLAVLFYITKILVVIIETVFSPSHPYPFLQRFEQELFNSGPGPGPVGGGPQPLFSNLGHPAIVQVCNT